MWENSSNDSKSLIGLNLEHFWIISYKIKMWYVKIHNYIQCCQSYRIYFSKTFLTTCGYMSRIFRSLGPFRSWNDSLFSNTGKVCLTSHEYFINLIFKMELINSHWKIYFGAICVIYLLFGPVMEQKWLILDNKTPVKTP